MSRENIEHVATDSGDLLAERMEGLRELAPEAFCEGRVDWDKLRATLGAEVDDRPERYTFSWAGKRDAQRILQTPSRMTLLPEPGESLDFDSTQHAFIEGENLEVLKLLRKSYHNRVKLIYIDPPYNTGNDFVYPDDFADPLGRYLTLTGQQDAAGNRLTTNPETSGRYHSAWLSMMYPRLFLARQLLRDDGVIFVSIDDHEVFNLRMVMNEVFGEENFIATVCVLNNPKGRVLAQHFASCHDYMLVYARSEQSAEFSFGKSSGELSAQYTEHDETGDFRSLELRNTHRQFGKHNRPNLFYPLYVDQKTGTVGTTSVSGSIPVLPLWDDGFEGCWTWERAKVERDNARVIAKKVGERWRIYRKAYALSETGEPARRKMNTMWLDKRFHTEKGQTMFDGLIAGRIFEAPKPIGLMQEFLPLVEDNEIMLDFFSGSASSAHAVLAQNREDGGNRRFILVQYPEPTGEAAFPTIADIGKERIRRVVARMKAEGAGTLNLDTRETPEDLGFRVFRLAESHIRAYEPPTGADPGAVVDALGLLLDPLRAGWTPEGALWEVAVREGYPLSSKVEVDTDTRTSTDEQGRTQTEEGGNIVYRISDADSGQSFRLCLDATLDDATVTALALTKDDLFICRDAALTDDQAANLALQCRLKTI